MEALKHHFQHSQAEICGKMALKFGDVFPLTFTLKRWLSGNSTYTIKLHSVNAVLLRVPFIIYHKIYLNIPFKLFFWSMTSLQLRCFSKSGHFAFRLRSSRDSGFSVKIGTVPHKSGRLDTLYTLQKSSTHYEFFKI